MIDAEGVSTWAQLNDRTNRTKYTGNYLSLRLVGVDSNRDAIENGIATPAELMSAGYNSNPAKLAGYIRRGGANWKNLIPRETKIYLQINASMDKFVSVNPRTK